jgi:hypothetical protein
MKGNSAVPAGSKSPNDSTKKSDAAPLNDKTRERLAIEKQEYRKLRQY